VCSLATPYIGKDVVFQNELERVPDAKPGYVSIDMRQTAITGCG
jgi:hypothetical protein